MPIDLGGCTRVVLLIGPYAIKIARPGWLTFAGRLIHHVRHGTVEHILNKYPGKELLDMAGAMIFQGGMSVNRKEAAYYRAHASLPIAPVRYLLLFGLIAVQDRGVPATESELLAWRPNQLAANGEPVDSEIVRAEHICNVRGRICLIDYGSPGSREDMLRIFA